MELAPIILFVYNRPEHTRRTVEALLNNEFAHSSSLYIFSDGPKLDANLNTINSIKQVRNYVHSIKGFKEVHICEQKQNLGLDNSVIYGVTQIIHQFGRCITVEDDIVTHPWFLRYMNECLNMYQDDNRIWMIGGYNVRMKVPFFYKKDVFLAHRCCSWGWGMWQNRWDSIDWDLNDYDSFLNNKRLCHKFCRGGNDMLPMLIDQMKYEVPAWDIRFDYTLMHNDGYVVRPVKSLVLNSGLDGSGIHCGVQDMVKSAAEQPNEDYYNIHLPSRIKPSVFIQKNFKFYFVPHSFLLERFKRLFRPSFLLYIKEAFTK